MPHEIYKDHVQTKTEVSKEEIWSRLLKTKKEEVMKRVKFQE